MSDHPPQYPDQNPPSGWPPPAQPGPAVPEQRDQSSNPPAPQSDQPPAYTEPPTTIAPANYPASPAYPAYPADPYAAPPAPAAPTGYPTTPYPPTPYPQPPAAVYPPVSGYPASPGYGQPVAVAPPSSGVATASMVLGILGLLVGWCSCGLPALLAIILGHMGLNQTRNNQKSGRGMALAGVILGYVAIVPAIIATVLVAIAIFGRTSYNTFNP